MAPHICNLRVHSLFILRKVEASATCSRQCSLRAVGRLLSALLMASSRATNAPDLAKVSVDVAQPWCQSFTMKRVHRVQATVARAFLAWLFQLLASCAWVASVIVYGSYESGDILQLLAALCWTLSNFIAMPDAVMPLFRRRGERPRAEVETATGV